MTLSNLLKCRLCDNVDLVLLCISRVLQCMTVLQIKILNKVSVKRLIFYKSDTFLQLKWRKFSAKAGQNRGFTAPSKPLVAIGEPQCDCVSTKNDRSNKKKPIFRPQLCVSVCFLFLFVLSFRKLGRRKEWNIPSIYFIYIALVKNAKIRTHIALFA